MSLIPIIWGFIALGVGVANIITVYVVIKDKDRSPGAATALTGLLWGLAAVCIMGGFGTVIVGLTGLYLEGLLAS